MSDGTDDPDAADPDSEDPPADETDVDDATDESDEPPTEDEITAALDEAESALDEATTEADLDAIEADLDAIDGQIETADLPESDDDEEDPETALSDRLSELRADLEDQRGPYADEIADTIAETATTIRDTRWTDDGAGGLSSAVGEFLAAVDRELPDGLSPDAEPSSVEDAESEELADATEAAANAIREAELDPDEDAATIAALLDASDDLSEATEAAEEFDDLMIREQLRAEGYFDVLGHYKDFPVEWAAMKEHEQQGNTEMILLALDKLDSEFLERHAMEALTRMNDQAAFEPIHAKAQKRDQPSIEALGKMAADEAVETLVEYVDEDTNPQLQKVTFKALGEIGNADAVGPLAEQLAADNDAVRPYAARALGMIGDTRAVAPLTDTLREDPDDSTRAAAAWALRQIGTERALQRAASAADDNAWIVQREAERAADALGVDAPPA